MTIAQDQSDEPLLDRPAAAEFLTRIGCTTSWKTLAKLAVTGGGPKFRHWGRFPRYTESDLRAWAGQRLSPLVASTAEAAALKSIKAA